MSFIGGSLHTLNEAGRISIPAKMREVLRDTYGDDRLILLLGLKYIKAYPLTEWGKLQRQLSEKIEDPAIGKNERDAIRFRLSNIDEAAVDKQGRILISPALRSAAELNNECMIVGHFTFFEIWGKESWDKNVVANMPTDPEAFGNMKHIFM